MITGYYAIRRGKYSVIYILLNYQFDQEKNII